MVGDLSPVTSFGGQILTTHGPQSAEIATVPSPPTVSGSSASFRVDAGVDPAAERHTVRTRHNFGSYTPAPIALSATGAHGHSNASASYRARFASGSQKVTLTASGAIDASAACTPLHCGNIDPRSDASASLGVSFQVPTSVPVTLPYTLVASLSASGHAPACATVHSTLAGNGSNAEDLLVQAPDSAQDPGCSAVPPGALSVLDEGTVETDASGEVVFQLSATISELDPGDRRTDKLHAAWAVTLTLFPPCTVLGDSSGQTLTGTSGADVICGMGGTDTLNGLGGPDVIFGGSDVDTIDGGAGNDTIAGLAGDDVIQGGAGDDVILGGEGSDTIGDIAGPNSQISGEDGDDAICGSNQKDVIAAGAGNDLVLGLVVRTPSIWALATTRPTGKAPPPRPWPLAASFRTAPWERNSATTSRVARETT